MSEQIISNKISQGRFFEDFTIGENIVHPLPRTVTDGDVSFYIALTGSRFALHSSDLLARQMGYKQRPLDDILVFHIVFGKSVTDVSLNAIANLGYAEVIFPNPVFTGDTVRLESTVIGLKENSERRPSQRSVNLYITRKFQLNKIQLQLFCNIYNLFDNRDETGVYSDTGTAEYTTNTDPNSIPYDPQRVGTIDDYVLRPDWYTAPREIQIGIKLGF